MNIVTDEPLAVKPGIYTPQAAQHLLARIAVRGAVEDEMRFVLNRRAAPLRTYCARAHVEWRDWCALRPRETAQAVAVEPEVHQDADIGRAVLVVALFGNEPPERRSGHM